MFAMQRRYRVRPVPELDVETVRRLVVDRFTSTCQASGRVLPHNELALYRDDPTLPFDAEVDAMLSK